MIMAVINFSGELEERASLVHCYCFLKIKVERTESLLQYLSGLLFELNLALVVEWEDWFYSARTLGR